VFNRIIRVSVHDALNLLIASETSEYLSLVSEAVVGAGPRLVKDMRPAQFEQGGLSSTPKRRGFGSWFNMGSPDPNPRTINLENVSGPGQTGAPNKATSR
jgi:hypothetical protein